MTVSKTVGQGSIPWSGAVSDSPLVTLVTADSVSSLLQGAPRTELLDHRENSSEMASVWLSVVRYLISSLDLFGLGIPERQG